MSGLRILGIVSIPIVVVLAGLFVILAFTGTGDKAEKDNRGLPVYSTPTSVSATATPLVHEGLPNCPSGWLGFADPDGHFSFCYPERWRVTSSLPDADLSTVAGLITPEDLGVITMYWRPASYFLPSTSDRCSVAPSWSDRGQVTLDLFGQSDLAACRGFENLKAPGLPPLLSTFVEVARGDGGYLTVFWYEAQGDDYAAERQDVAAVLDSLR